MSIDIETIKKLRQMTGVGITDAKKALEETAGDFDKALENMRIKGLAKADKRSEREAKAGIIDAYVHSERIGVIVEVNCETDFVARNDAFKELAHDIALHVAAFNPLYVSEEDMPADVAEKEKSLISAELADSGKPAEIVEQMSQGKFNKYLDEVILMRQSFVKDPSKTVGDIVKDAIAKLGENIVVKRFKRISLGEVE